jgi:hypothetical protein
MLKKLMRIMLSLGCLVTLNACSKSPEFVAWQEEVKLNDGRVIVVEQKKRADRGIAREAWLTINLPEFSAQRIVWHENLSPLVVNVDDGRLYVVGYPPTVIEFNHYDKPHPAYVGFVWKNGTWVRIPFEKIPTRIYTTNMLIDGFPENGTTLLRLEKKNSRELNGEPTHLYGLRRIDPTFSY